MQLEPGDVRLALTAPLFLPGGLVRHYITGVPLAMTLLSYFDIYVNFYFMSILPNFEKRMIEQKTYKNHCCLSGNQVTMRRWLRCTDRDTHGRI